MSEHIQSNGEKITHGQQIWLSVIGLLLGGVAIWYAWLRFTSLFSRSDRSWHDWIQPSMVVLFGLLSLVSAVLFILLRHEALSYFKLGLSVVPLILFANLLILLFRAAASVWQGNAAFLIDRVLAQPQKFILIPVIIIALIMLDRINKSDDQKTT